MTEKNLLSKQAYELAKARYASAGVDTDAVLKTLNEIPISIQCWQGDDVLGFESNKKSLSGGIQTSGNYPGRARTADELRQDLEEAFKLIPGKKRLNLHAIYIDTEEAVERDVIEPKHFQKWVDWAKKNNIALDFNPTCFSHPKSADGLTLSHPDDSIRKFWVDHCIASRKISEYFGEQLGTPAIMNVWIPDGMKDIPADRLAARLRLKDSLDQIIGAFEGKNHKVAVEGKLFGIGAESFTVGSNDFYTAYAAQNNTLLCLDAGHYHPTEDVSDKISSALIFVDELQLHVSRPVRWDSDHVVLLDDPTMSIAREIVRCNAIDRVNIGLDFFDASINRIAAWTVGTRNMRKALLLALLEPKGELQQLEKNFDYTARLVLSEEYKSMPWAAVWDYYCSNVNVPVGADWLGDVRAYETNVLSKRG